MWLTLLSFLLNTLIQYIKDWYDNFRLFSNLEEMIIDIRSVDDEKQLLQKVVSHIAAEFKYPHANIFQLFNGSLRCVVSASKEGHLLVDSSYLHDITRGIIGYVAREGNTYYSNDVSHDQYYYNHQAFIDTKAELASPIKVRGKIFGVLDIQDNKKDVFFPQDIEVVQTLCRHLGVILDNFQFLFELSQRITNITNSIANRFLSQHELEKILDDIAEAALKEFNAEFSVIYERNPDSGQVIASSYKGELLCHNSPDLHPQPGGLVHKLLSSKEDFFNNNLDEIKLTNKDLYVDRKRTEPTFPDQEQIQSRVIVHLSTDVECLGLLFVNFRKPHRFDEIEKSRFYTFAHLAALALEKSRVYLRQIRVERQRLATDLHDSIKSTSDGLYGILRESLKESSLSGNQQINLTNAMDAVQSIQSDVFYLISVLRETP